MGGGKTTAIANETIQLAMSYAGTQLFVGRRYSNDLRNNTAKEIFKFLPPQMRQEEYRYSSHYNELLLKRTGSIIYFDDLDTWKSKFGPEYQAVIIDQAEEVSEEAALALITRLRLPDETRLHNIRQAGLTPERAGYKPGEIQDEEGEEPHIPYYFVCAFNPEPNWVKEWFYDDTELIDLDGVLCHVKNDHLYIPALPFDNPHTPSSYVQRQTEIMPSEWVQRYIYGQWIHFADRAFPDFDTSVHLIEPFNIPPLWPVFRAIDHGASSSSGTACLWAAVNGQCIFIFDEYLQYSTNVIDNAQAIQEQYPGKIYCTFIDPSTTKGSANDLPIKEQYRRLGLHTKPAGNSIDASVTLAGSLLRVDPELQHPITKQQGSPHIFMFKTLKQLPEKIIECTWQKTRQGETTHDLKRRDSDLVDAFRYLIMGIGLGVRRELPKYSYSVRSGNA
mgnify:CR=1 FL=1